MDIEKERVIALVDMGCFYVQVEQRINPELKNIQYIHGKARAHGVSRNMWADDARKLCPDLQGPESERLMGRLISPCKCAFLHPIML
uniref:UmuC domain-containing protein n=1 Tax=Cyprinus carpio TaxID=7962 RepID=A0A8C1VBY1_CYPCA